MDNAKPGGAYQTELASYEAQCAEATAAEQQFEAALPSLGALRGE